MRAEHGKTPEADGGMAAGVSANYYCASERQVLERHATEDHVAVTEDHRFFDGQGWPVDPSSPNFSLRRDAKNPVGTWGQSFEGSLT